MGRLLPNADRAALAAAAIADLDQDKPVDIHLPGGGRLYLERRVPLVCVHRLDATAAGIEQLIADEPAYLLLPSATEGQSAAIKLLRAIVEKLAECFGGCAVVEIRQGTAGGGPVPQALDAGGFTAASPFELCVSADCIPKATVEALLRALGRDVPPYGGTRIVLGPHDCANQRTEKSLLRRRNCVDWNCYELGITVRPNYLDEHGKIIPERLRSMSRTLHYALERAAFAFVHQRKTLGPTHFHAPGRRSVVKAVFDIDRQLAEIGRSFDLLLQATPINAEGAWAEFRRSKFEKPPTFYYRPLAVDPVLLKRHLFAIPVERIEDPTLAYLFCQKQDELDRQITLLTDVDSPRFLPESLQIYGGVSDWLMEHAQELLDRLPSRRSEGPKQEQVSATQFAMRAQQELGYYQKRRADFCAKVAVRDDIYTGLMVSGEQLLIGGRTQVPRRRVEALLQHEIGTHLVTRYNGHHQPFRQLEVGLAGYDGFQEGLAVLAEFLVGGLSRFRMRVLAARVVGAHYLLNGASFVDTFRALTQDYEFSQRTAYTIAMRLYRGGGLTKDAVYLRGLLQILRYLRDGGDLKPLFVGKVASSHLPFISELSMRGIIRPPALRPRYLESASARRKIDRLRSGLKPLDLVK